MTWSELKRSRERNTAEQIAYDRERAAIAFGRQIHQKRCDLGLSVLSLARRVGTSPTMIERIETGDAQADLTILLRVAEMLRLPAPEPHTSYGAGVG